MKLMMHVSMMMTAIVEVDVAADGQTLEITIRKSQIAPNIFAVSPPEVSHSDTEAITSTIHDQVIHVVMEQLFLASKKRAEKEAQHFVVSPTPTDEDGEPQIN